MGGARALIAAGVCALATGGCPPGGHGGNDLSPPPDLSASADLTPTQRTGCNGYVNCINNCAPGDTACTGQCKANTTSAGFKIYSSALFCAESWCLDLNDIGTGECVLDSSMTMLIDPPGRPGVCQPCLDNAMAQLLGLACTPANSPDCNPPICRALYMQCNSDGP
jgi:hypothetical protein